eukprot:scaffold6103_cov116-Cylindrotheca_fusiformis.AAC.3
MIHRQSLQEWRAKSILSYVIITLTMLPTTYHQSTLSEFSMAKLRCYVWGYPHFRPVLRTSEERNVKRRTRSGLVSVKSRHGSSPSHIY